MSLVIIAVIGNITNLIRFLFNICIIFQGNAKIYILIKNVCNMQITFCMPTDYIWIQICFLSSYFLNK